jgi:hypothetical protein
MQLGPTETGTVTVFGAFCQENRDGGPMYISCLANDYDGTLAHDGIVEDATAEAFIAFIRSGRRLLLVTGRELPDLIRVWISTLPHSGGEPWD